MIYSTTPGTLKISAVENKLNGTIAVSVRDSGIGMTQEPERLGRPFQPPYAIEARGIGLGAGGEEADGGQRRQGRGEKRTGQRGNLCCYLAGRVGIHIHQEELI